MLLQQPLHLLSRSTLSRIVCFALLFRPTTCDEEENVKARGDSVGLLAPPTLLATGIAAVDLDRHRIEWECLLTKQGIVSLLSALSSRITT